MHFSGLICGLYSEMFFSVNVRSFSFGSFMFRILLAGDDSI